MLMKVVNLLPGSRQQIDRVTIAATLRQATMNGSALLAAMKPSTSALVTSLSQNQLPQKLRR